MQVVQGVDICGHNCNLYINLYIDIAGIQKDLIGLIGVLPAEELIIRFAPGMNGIDAQYSGVFLYLLSHAPPNRNQHMYSTYRVEHDYCCTRKEGACKYIYTVHI